MSKRSILAIIGVCAFLGLLVFGLLSKGSANLEVGEPVPDKTLPKLDGGGGGKIADYRGDWVLVNLWASWCGPCRGEAPVLEDYYRQNRKRDVTVLGINVQDNSEDASAFVKEFGLTYPQLRSVGDDRSDAFGTTGVPENFLVNPKGKLALIWRGVVDEEFLRENVTPIIEGT